MYHGFHGNVTETDAFPEDRAMTPGVSLSVCLFSKKGVRYTNIKNL